MKFLIDFLHQEIPKSDKGMPSYYRKALLITQAVLSLYFLTSAVVLARVTTDTFLWQPIAILAASVVSLFKTGKIGARLHLPCVSVIVGLWVMWFVHRFGWSTGIPSLLVPILSLAFFNIYEPPWGKIAYFLGLIGFRVALFTYSLDHTAVAQLDHSTMIFFQVLNSMTPMLILAVTFILFSSSIQASERELTINNQELHKEAGTDPLTGLLNRRSLLDEIEEFRSENPVAPFGIAIADIDFFKKVNDTYGHNCGDYTLKELSRLFTETVGDKCRICRWGGEEFCFFIPGLNLDDAAIVMNDLNMAVKRMPLHFNDIDFSITITIGVEENDFKSPTETILDRADRKLYMGKVHGRDQVVV